MLGTNHKRNLNVTVSVPTRALWHIPTGNYMGQFSENVYPPVDGSRRRQALGSGEL